MAFCISGVVKVSNFPIPFDSLIGGGLRSFTRSLRVDFPTTVGFACVGEVVKSIFSRTGGQFSLTVAGERLFFQNE
jgi:hypothetical protein